MRTTLNIADDVYRELKVRAAQEGVTVTSVIEEVLRGYLARPVQGTQTLTLPLLPESGGTRPGIDLDDRGQVFDFLYGDDVRHGDGSSAEGPLP